MKVRLRFQKTGLMRWVGHLDLMRFFQKAIRRAQLPIAYSAGFHPHQILSFALPLGIGLTSEGEYLDMELTQEVDPKEAMERLNEQMAEGMQVTSFRYLPEKSKKAMSLVTAAKYYVYLKSAPQFAANDWNKAIRRFYVEAKDIPIIKQTKKGERQLDLKPLIYDFVFVPDEARIPASLKTEAAGSPGFFLLLSAGSVDNIKPELVFSHFLKTLGIEEGDLSPGIHRMELYGPEGESL